MFVLALQDIHFEKFAYTKQFILAKHIYKMCIATREIIVELSNQVKPLK